jgi:hypothetical protein
MGRLASSVDNSMIESFWSTMQREVLDTAICRIGQGRPAFDLGEGRRSTVVGQADVTHVV